MSSVQEATRRSRLFSGFLVLFVALILVRAIPLISNYVAKLLAKHRLSVVAIAGFAGAAGFALLVLAIRQRPRATLALLGAAALVLVVASGNLVAVLIALAILALTLLAGDAVSRLLRGREAGDGDLSGVFAAGVAAMGILPLLLGEVGLFRPAGIAGLAIALLVTRRRRVPGLARLLLRSLRLPRGGSPRLLEPLWIAA